MLTLNKQMDTMQLVYMISCVLVIVGGLNWGSIGLFNYNIVEMYLGPMYATYVYNIVGLAAVVLIICKVIKYNKKGSTIQTAISA